MDLFLEYLRAFLVGGALCAFGQLLIDYTGMTPARILVCYVIGGVVLSALGLYQPFLEFAGAGASVPLTGFGNLLATGVRRQVAADGLLGVFSGGLTASAAGVGAAMLFALVNALLFLPREK